MYDTSRYTANTKMYSGILHTHTHTYTHRWGGGGVGLLIICRFEEMSFMDFFNSYLVLLHNIPLFWKQTDESA